MICPIVSKICWSSTLLTEYILYVSISIILLAWEVIEGCTDRSVFIFEFRWVIIPKEEDWTLQEEEGTSGKWYIFNLVLQEILVMAPEMQEDWGGTITGNVY